ncbi:CATRA conflict system CASPASE/TPR repeat-associated protein [Micromonospora sp. 4G57]|uniref:CATRA conflict system CASPASE/TPR repeat-associated protein n=1 Tax=Micromonospora sicca TaxID=2202420 RepID=A0ABU5JN20_9ACTN|nr:MULTISPECIES: CATRA conflict system CASPASE/TPR repeat-associated protein [unclassified Micromonospora]MDZ5446509.1 CATRA conflict system CASPASE/TPR repeat-associated protein [Micromonospora sp. 4G57]MDZ5494034.1 CATRA conflict system CASPASE/TPR repeat-associated protein [Micromonospora sp. 4G53]
MAHLFAPLDGPNAGAARRQLDHIWRRCRRVMTEPIPRVPAELPDTVLEVGADQALAGRQDPGVNYQAIVRREHDVLNLSVAFAGPRGGEGGAPGWIDFDRWWRRLASDGTSAFLGLAVIFQAKAPTPSSELATLTDAVRAALPADPADRPDWWTDGHRTPHGLAVWETSAAGNGSHRRFVVLATGQDDDALSGFTWSDGTSVLPSLGRYLLHASKLRYQDRVRGDGRPLRQLEAEITARLNPASGPDRGTVPRADELRLISTLSALRAMLRTVDIALDNMHSAYDRPFGGDRSLGEWLCRQLPDDISYLETVLEQVKAVRGVLVDPGPVRGNAVPSVMDAPPADPATDDDKDGPRLELRLGFGVDIVGYSGRSGPAQADAQKRLAETCRRVLWGLGLRLTDTDRQHTGDGMNVFLPSQIQLHKALPRLLDGFDRELADDNARYQDRIRLRVATSVGLAGIGDLGFSGEAILEISRLLNSSPLREAVNGNPGVDLVAMVSDTLHRFVIRPGWVRLAPERFERHLVELKEYTGLAWVWIGSARP